MHFRFCLLLILFFLGAVCCDNKPNYKVTNSITINIQPFVGMSNENTLYVAKELIKIYPNVVVLKPIDLPKSAFYSKRNRYRADSLINFLNAKTNSDVVTIGLTEKDISSSKGSISDWGIMGLGFCPGKACIASTYRLSKTKTKAQLFKVAIHELGHTEGLPHCSVKTCFMRDAEGKNSTDDEIEFCPKCKKQLVDKGWRFN
jgi:archaemetzincin